MTLKPAGLYLIGMTGNIACGKSSVLEMLIALGAATIDADQVTRELQQPGRPVYQQIVAAFGEEMLLHPNGPLDRQKLGALVFRHPAELRRLEVIVHPAVHAALEAWLDQVWQRVQEERARLPMLSSADDGTRSRPVAVIDAIKLLEANWKPSCDAVWVVTCHEEQQLERLMTSRGMSEAEARQRIAAQASQASKAVQADVVIDNSGPLTHTRAQVEQAWRRITA